MEMKLGWLDTGMKLFNLQKLTCFDQGMNGGGGGGGGGGGRFLEYFENGADFRIISLFETSLISN